MTEAGKTFAEARGEIGRAIDTLQWNGEQAGRIEGRIIPGVAEGSTRYSVPTPLGVVAAFQHGRPATGPARSGSRRGR